MKYVFILFLYLATGVQSSIPDVSSFASVREYPTYLHRCTATFVSQDFLLTTAACVLCADKCKLQIQAFSSHLEGNFDPKLKPQTFNVTEIHYHPQYPVYPETHNVALIRINEKAPNAPVYDVANFTKGAFGFQGSVFSWQFTPDMKDYLLQKINGESVSNTACSSSLNKYVSHFFICVMADKLLNLGPFDQGTPFTITFNNKPAVAGLYDESGFVHNMKFVTYQSLQPFYNWIQNILHSSHV